VADILDGQGEVVLAGDVRYFARNLPRVQMDREKLAAQFVEYVRSRQSEAKRPEIEAPAR
jgi:hypothetical protein